MLSDGGRDSRVRWVGQVEPEHDTDPAAGRRDTHDDEAFRRNEAEQMRHGG
jgi:hypothetical protein